jgi:hypothetical protein
MKNQNLQSAAELFKPDRFKDAIDNQPTQRVRRSVTAYPFLAAKEARQLAELAELLEQADRRLESYRNTSAILSRLDIFNHKPTMLNRIDTLERGIVRLKLRYNKMVLALTLLKV